MPGEYYIFTLLSAISVISWATLREWHLHGYPGNLGDLGEVVPGLAIASLAISLVLFFCEPGTVPADVADNFRHVVKQREFRREMARLERMAPEQRHFYLWNKGIVNLRGEKVQGD